MEESKKMGKGKKWLGNMAVLAAGTVVSLLVLEVILRIFNIQPGRGPMTQTFPTPFWEWLPCATPPARLISRNTKAP